MSHTTTFARTLGIAVAAALLAAPALSAQPLRPPSSGGLAALDYALRGLDQNKRVLVIGAHPDDEDTELLTLLSRGLGVEAAYLSLSRGEGGQNLIGSELGEALGLLRTEELLSARGVDGAHQFFTRAFDFGFSKTLDESLRFWPRDTLLADAVRVIRRFRPQVIVSVFSGTPRDGHGQHQAAGVTARAAFDLLRDSTWGPKKLFRAARFDTGGTTVRIAWGGLDPETGRSYHQLAMADRSLHRSQEMGRLQDLGPSTARLSLVEDLTGRAAANDPPGLFDGIDTALAPTLARYAALIDTARSSLLVRDPARVAGLLAAALVELRRGPDDFRARKEAALENALAAAAGVVADAYADDGRLTPGERFSATALWWSSAGGSLARLDSVTLETPPGWEAHAEALPPPERGFAGVFNAPREGVDARRMAVTVALGEPLTEPYFLARPRLGDLYDWSAAPDSLRGEPFQPPLVYAVFHGTIAGAPVDLARELTYRYDDEALGEMRRPLVVVPVVGVEVAPTDLVWPIAAGGARTVTVTLTNGLRARDSGTVGIDVPAGWPPVAPQPFALDGEDTRRAFTFEVRAPRGGARPGTDTLRAWAATAAGRSDRATELVDYPHIRPVAYVRPAVLSVTLADLVLPRLTRVGYVRGAADAVPEALQAVGVPVTLLTAADLERGDLSLYDVIVVGSRAYETEPALVTSNGRLLDYARRGGRLIVQYQQYPFVRGRYAPFPFTIASPHDRVTDETAPVTLLQPGSALFRTPNAIGPSDWDGWVQERGLYFAHTWDSAYTPLLESGDNGEKLDGGLLVAHLGRGLYVYTGIAFFRQLPAGVAGAYRLFANLLALRPGDVP